MVSKILKLTANFGPLNLITFGWIGFMDMDRHGQVHGQLKTDTFRTKDLLLNSILIEFNQTSNSVVVTVSWHHSLLCSA